MIIASGPTQALAWPVMTGTAQYRFEVALSFPGEYRARVETNRAADTEEVFVANFVEAIEKNESPA